MGIIFELIFFVVSIKHFATFVSNCKLQIEKDVGRVVFEVSLVLIPFFVEQKANLISGLIFMLEIVIGAAFFVETLNNTFRSTCDV